MIKGQIQEELKTIRHSTIMALNNYCDYGRKKEFKNFSKTMFNFGKTW